MLQFFDRNQTSATINSQPLEIGNVPPTPPKIDIGKLNWTDASFDKSLKAIDFSKITTQEFQKILDETLKHSSCPQGSFYDSSKGCISFENFGIVPQSPRSIDIDALFNRPLISISSEKEKSPESFAGSLNLETENSGKLFELLSKLDFSKLSIDQLKGISMMMKNYSPHSDLGKLSDMLPKFDFIEGSPKQVEQNFTAEANQLETSNSEIFSEKLPKLDISKLSSDQLNQISTVMENQQPSRSSEKLLEIHPNLDTNKLTQEQIKQILMMIENQLQSSNSKTILEKLPEVGSSKLSAEQLQQILMMILENHLPSSISAKLPEMLPKLDSSKLAQQLKQVSMVKENFLFKSPEDVAHKIKEFQIDEGEIPTIFEQMKSNMLEPMPVLISEDHLPSAEEQNLKPQSGVWSKASGVQMEINPDLDGRLQLMFGTPNRTLQQRMKGDTMSIHPQIIKETVPIKMSMRIPGNVFKSHETVDEMLPININLPFDFLKHPKEQSAISVNSPKLNGLKNDVSSAFISFGEMGKAVGDKLAARFQHSVESQAETQEDKLAHTNEKVETASEHYEPPKVRGKQAFFIHEVPLISRKSAEKENIAEVTTKTAPMETATSATASNPTIGFPFLIPKLVESGKDIMATKNKVLSNFFPRLFNGRRFASPEQTNEKENVEEIIKNVPRPKIVYNSVEGKTLAENLDEIATTEALRLKTSTLKYISSKVTTSKPAVTRLHETPDLSEEEITEASVSPMFKKPTTRPTKTNKF